MFLINYPLVSSNKGSYSTNESVDGLDTISDFTNKLNRKNHNQNWQYAIRSEVERKFKISSNLQLMFEGVANDH